ncbi:MAG TPA: membrane protein insertion efficiency factor YidD [Opitutaceae bacterium]|nr:membrane protein insertion efficiency factor YidD [Opitutaceae bacterium]
MSKTLESEPHAIGTPVTARPILALLWLYKNLISLPLHLAAGPGAGCRFHPSCSEYASEAVRVHGALRGSWLALKRFIKCSPLHSGGVDFVPPRGALRPSCGRITRTTPDFHG